MRRLLRKLIIWALGGDPITLDKWNQRSIDAIKAHTEAVEELTEQQKRAAAIARRFPGASGLGGLSRY